MDGHKREPWRNVRGFLKEYAIIVVGVLTALGAGQVVESLHERQIADEARESIRAEVRENLWWMEQRESHEACTRQRLAEIGAILDHARRRQPYPTPLQVGRPYHPKITTLRWQANAQAGRASLFTPQEQRYLGNMYYSTEQYAEAQAVDEDAWTRMHAIEGLDHLTPAEIDQFATLLAQVRHANAMMTRGLERAHQWAALMHLKADNPNAFEVAVGPNGGEACPSISAPPTGRPEDAY